MSATGEVAETASRRKRVAIVQSNYIPWKGYFDLINAVDEFILFDTVQYTTRDWRNRNRIKTAQGPIWLTIPTDGTQSMRICDVQAVGEKWRRQHWDTLSHAYAKAPYFRTYRERLRELWIGQGESGLSTINRTFIEELCAMLGIRTRITASMDYRVDGGKTERLVSLCVQAGATDYLSGPSAKAYVDASLFAGAGVRLHWMDYSGYREYPQPHPPFEPAVSVVDLLFCVGPEARDHLRKPGQVIP
jgi:hypothetical protein